MGTERGILFIRVKSNCSTESCWKQRAGTGTALLLDCHPGEDNGWSWKGWVRTLQSVWEINGNLGIAELGGGCCFLAWNNFKPKDRERGFGQRPGVPGQGGCLNPLLLRTFLQVLDPHGAWDGAAEVTFPFLGFSDSVPQ